MKKKIGNNIVQCFTCLQFYVMEWHSWRSGKKHKIDAAKYEILHVGETPNIYHKKMIFFNYYFCRILLFAWVQVSLDQELDPCKLQTLL